MAVRKSFGSVREIGKARFQARYTGPDGGRYTGPVRYRTKTDANAFLAQTHADISKGTWKSPTEISNEGLLFGEYAAQWVEARAGLTVRTRRGYKSLARRFLLPAFGSKALRSITKEQVRLWVGSLPAHQPTQNHHAYSLLRTIMATAVDEEKIPINPVALPGQDKIAKKEKRRYRKVVQIKVLKDRQIAMLADAMDGRYRAMVYVAAYCCLRFGELTELRRRDLVDGVLNIERAVTWVKEDEDIDGSPLIPMVGPPKSEAGTRSIPMPPPVRKVLAEHILRYAQPGDDGLLFPGVESDMQMKHGALYKVFRRARRDLGRQDLSWHGLRHTGAVLFALEGATVRELMTLLGHETPTMAMHYQHVADGRLSTLADRVGDRMTADALLGDDGEDIVLEVDAADLNQAESA